MLMIFSFNLSFAKFILIWWTHVILHLDYLLKDKRIEMSDILLCIDVSSSLDLLLVTQILAHLSVIGQQSMIVSQGTHWKMGIPLPLYGSLVWKWLDILSHAEYLLYVSYTKHYWWYSW